MNRLVLSICIPTYNRIGALKELVDQLLSIQSDGFEVVVTDNQSTDCTHDVLKSYHDDRVRYIRNEVALPALNNVIHSIFNAKGKYALYCNDRDLLYPERVEQLIDLLNRQDYSFVACPRGKKRSDKVEVYEKGYDSLLHQNCVHHPTGMVFNRQIIEKHLHEEYYYRFLDVVYTYDFLMLDLLKYEKSAICHLGYWSSRDIQFLKNHRSGTGKNLYFMPETRAKTFEAIVKHIYDGNPYALSLQQKTLLLDKIYDYFAVLFCNYKLCLSDINESAHYGLERKFVSTLTMINMYRSFFYNSTNSTLQFVDEEIVRWIVRMRKKYYKTVVTSCIKIDLLTIFKAFKV